MRIDTCLPKRSLTRTFAATALTLAAVCGCGREAAEETSESSTDQVPVLKAEVLKLEATPWPTIVRTQGTLFADEVAVVGAKVAGRVSEVQVDLGDAIEAGAPLVLLDRDEFELQVSQAEAQLQQARAAVGLKPGDPLEKLNPEAAPPVREAKAVWDEAITKKNRWSQLRTQSVITAAELEQYVAAEQVAAAQYLSAMNAVNEKIALIHVRMAELSLAQQRLEDALVPAPFDGIIQERHVAPGSYVQIGEPIVTIVRNHPLHFRGNLPEHAARGLQRGQTVHLQIESMAAEVQTRVSRISPALDPLSRSLSFEAEVLNEDGRLRAGLFAQAQVVVDEAATKLVVPESAVIEFAGVEKAWVVSDGMSREQLVLTGEHRDGRAEIVDGLQPGDLILVSASEGKVARVEPIFPNGPRTALSTPTDSLPAQGD